MMQRPEVLRRDEVVIRDRLALASAGRSDWAWRRRSPARRPLPGSASSSRGRQWLFVFILLGSAALIVWLYWHEGKASRASKLLLAALRMALVLLAMFMLSEAVLSVERKGLPYLTILVDDSASERIRRPVREARDQVRARRARRAGQV